MKKILFLLVMLFTFLSCSDDDHECTLPAGSQVDEVQEVNIGLTKRNYSYVGIVNDGIFYCWGDAVTFNEFGLNTTAVDTLWIGVPAVDSITVIAEQRSGTSQRFRVPVVADSVYSLRM
ncbi:MAG: hypothetical protein GY774_00255 [Planctomycetes bacterium]|nr:hypothetical protein [Planctomycetota bacterium]